MGNEFHWFKTTYCKRTAGAMLGAGLDRITSSWDSGRPSTRRTDQGPLTQTPAVRQIPLTSAPQPRPPGSRCLRNAPKQASFSPGARINAEQRGNRTLDGGNARRKGRPAEFPWSRRLRELHSRFSVDAKRNELKLMQPSLGAITVLSCGSGVPRQSCSA